MSGTNNGREPTLATASQVKKWPVIICDGRTETDIKKSPLKRQGRLMADQKATLSPSDPDSLLAIAKDLLFEKFQCRDFRDKQEDVIRAIFAGHNTLIVSLTGKRMCYQIPAIAFPAMDALEGRAATENDRESAADGLALVITPWVHLMESRINGLKKRGMTAWSHSNKAWAQQLEIRQAIRDKKLRILYCTPEQVDNEAFIESMKAVSGGIRLLAIDEAHCISEVSLPIRFPRSYTFCRSSEMLMYVTNWTAGALVQTGLLEA